MTDLKNNINPELNSLENIKGLQIIALQNLQASRMKTDEKQMRFAMLPYMDEDQLNRLIALLKKENKEVIDLYFSFLKS